MFYALLSTDFFNAVVKIFGDSRVAGVGFFIVCINWRFNMLGCSRSRHTIHHFRFICVEKAMSYLLMWWSKTWWIGIIVALTFIAATPFGRTIRKVLKAWRDTSSRSLYRKSGWFTFRPMILWMTLQKWYTSQRIRNPQIYKIVYVGKYSFLALAESGGFGVLIFFLLIIFKKLRTQHIVVRHLFYF